MNKLDRTARAQILGMMVEGMSMQSITRLTGASKNTVAKLLRDAGEAFIAYHDANIRNVKAKRVQCDEIWSFCAMKEKNVPAAQRGQLGLGDVYMWTGLDSYSKLIVSYLVGKRNARYARVFVNDLAERLAGRVQLTTDGHKAYLSAVEDAFGSDVDYAMLVKLYGESTSPVVRQNLSMRMGMRRFTRLTNGFSKKIKNHEYALAIYFMHYNFVRIHQSLRVTPAMEAGISDKLWSLDDLVALIEANEPPPKKRGTYKKREIRA